MVLADLFQLGLWRVLSAVKAKSPFFIPSSHRDSTLPHLCFSSHVVAPNFPPFSSQLPYDVPFEQLRDSPDSVCMLNNNNKGIKLLGLAS